MTEREKYIESAKLFDVSRSKEDVQNCMRHAYDAAIERAIEVFLDHDYDKAIAILRGKAV